MGSWQKREKERALDRQANESGFSVIPVLLPGVDDPALDFLGLNTRYPIASGGDSRRVYLDSTASTLMMGAAHRAVEALLEHKNGRLGVGERHSKIYSVARIRFQTSCVNSRCMTTVSTQRE